jgi:hypothetical protein
MIKGINYGIRQLNYPAVHGGVRGNTEEGLRWRGKWIEKSVIKRKIPL